MKIAIIASKDRRNSVFTERGLNMLRELGEVVMNEGEADLESLTPVALFHGCLLFLSFLMGLISYRHFLASSPIF